jgi:hypothetical protein
MKDERKGQATEAFERYTRSFQSLDPRAASSHFGEPALMISPRGVVALPNAAAVEQLYAQVMGELRQKRYARTQFAPLVERRLADDLAVVSGAGAWMNDSGEEFSRFGMTYTFRRSREVWQIVVAIIHEAQADPLTRSA